MCPEHWRQVPTRMQHEVWSSWRHLRHSKQSTSLMLLRLRLKRYREARQAAIMHVFGLQKGYA